MAGEGGGLVFGKAYKQYDAVDAKNRPIFVTEMADGSKSVLTGWDAQVATRNMYNPSAFGNHLSSDVRDVLIKSNPDDRRNSGAKYKVQKFLHDIAYTKNKSLPGKILDKGALWGTGLGAGVGFTGGALADLALDLAGVESPINFKLLGAVGLGGLGAYLGHRRKSIIDEHKLPLSDKAGIEDPATFSRFSNTTGADARQLMKRAAMYNNPKNFILEKLQADTSLGFAEKAKLAAAVRSMEFTEAEALKELVREALGIDIGHVISKFIFKTEMPGALFGGITAFLGQDLAQTLTP